MHDYEKQVAAERARLLYILGRLFTPAEYEKLTEVLAFARHAHEGQRRKSGEPYILHPMAVALIVAESMGLGYEAVAAAFLHDVVEDTPCTIDTLRQRFGSGVARLVSVLTKQKKARYDTSKQVDNFRQILQSLDFNAVAVLSRHTSTAVCLPSRPPCAVATASP